MALYSTLVEAHGRYTVARDEVARLQDDVLPKLTKAEQAAERAYRAGAISYLEWRSCSPKGPQLCSNNWTSRSMRNVPSSKSNGSPARPWLPLPLPPPPRRVDPAASRFPRFVPA